jgi:hypothetical protein
MMKRIPPQLRGEKYFGILRVPWGSDPRWRGPATYTKDIIVLSSERAPHKNKTVTVKEL